MNIIYKIYEGGLEVYAILIALTIISIIVYLNIKKNDKFSIVIYKAINSHKVKINVIIGFAILLNVLYVLYLFKYEIDLKSNNCYSINKELESINIKDYPQYAIFNNDKREIRFGEDYFIENIANIGGPLSCTPSELKSLTTICIKNRNNISRCANYDKIKKCMFESVITNNISNVKYIIGLGCKLNDKYDGKTLLMYAILKNYYVLSELLISYGANVNAIDDDGKTVTYYAVKNGKKEYLALLYNNRAKIVHVDKNHTTPLMISSFYNNYSLALYIINNYPMVKINAKDNNKKTALMYGCEKGNQEIVKMLLSKGANVNEFDKNYNTSLNYAVSIKNINIVKALVEQNNGIKNRNSAIFEAMANNSNDILFYLIDKNIDLFNRDSYGRTILMHAAHNGNDQLVKKLIFKKDLINLKDYDNNTALLYSFYKNNYAIMEMLINNGADVNVKDINGRTLLMYAAAYGNTKLIKQLIDNKVNLDLVDKYNISAVMYAYSKKYFNIVEILINSGCNVNIKDKNNRTLLMYSSAYGNYEMVKLLLNRKAFIDLVDNENMTALMYAYDNNKYKIVEYLLDNGASIDVKNRKGMALFKNIIKENISRKTKNAKDGEK